jgi:hypothetical protein
MRTDPGTVCTSASHTTFKQLAITIISVIGPGVPVGYALLIWRLNHVGGGAAAPSAWRGLSDPATRASYGGLYEMYRYSSPPDALLQGEEEQPRTYCARLHLLRYKISVAVSPYFESLLFVEKLLLVLSMQIIPTLDAQAGAQAAVYAVFSVLLVCVWPYRKLDVRIGVHFWWPCLSRCSMPPDGEAITSYHVGWRKGRWGYMWRQHVTLVDALNFTALSSQVVPLLNILLTVLAGGRGAGVLAIFLIGLNCTQIGLTLAAWISCVVTWQTQTKELLKLDRARAAIKALRARRRAYGDTDSDDDDDVLASRARLATAESSDDDSMHAPAGVHATPASLIAMTRAMQLVSTDVPALARWESAGAMLPSPAARDARSRDRTKPPGCFPLCWAWSKTIVGVALSELTDRSYQEVCTAIRDGGAMMAAFTASGRYNRRTSLRDTIEALTMATIAHLQLRHDAVMREPEARELAPEIVQQIAELQRLYAKHGYAQPHHKTPAEAARDRKAAQEARLVQRARFFTRHFGRATALSQRLAGAGASAATAASAPSGSTETVEGAGLSASKGAAICLVTLVVLALSIGTITDVQLAPQLKLAPPPPPLPPPLAPAI